MWLQKYLMYLWTIVYELSINFIFRVETNFDYISMFICV